MVLKNKKKNTEEEGISFAPDDQEASSGLLSDVDVEFEEVDCTTFDYNGKVVDDEGNPVEVPAIKIKMVADDGQESEQYIVCGDLDKIVPSEDGSTFIPAEGSSAKGIGSQTNGGYFMRSLGDAGFPFSHDEGLPEDISPRNIRGMLQGGRFHILRVPEPKRGGAMASSEKKSKYPREIVTVSEIKRLPWDKKKKDSASKAKPVVKGKAAKDADEDEDEEEEEENDVAAAAVKVVKELLKSPKHKKGISTDDLAELAFAATKANPERKAILAAIQEEDFLEEGGFTVDEDGLITL